LFKACEMLCIVLICDTCRRGRACSGSLTARLFSCVFGVISHRDALHGLAPFVCAAVCVVLCFQIAVGVLANVLQCLSH